jgi:hypothetical protein
LEQNNRSKSANDESEIVTHQRVMTMNIPLACLIAAAASWRLQYVYGLAKLRLSLETFSLPIVELDPYHSDNVPKSPLPEDHVRLAFAIVTAYSCIEELGLEVRASNKNPSILPNGTWNPVIRSNLERRSGSVEVTDISDAHLHVKTLNGPISLADIRNSHLDIHSVRGNVNLHNVTGPSVEVNSGAGRITYDGDPGRVGQYLLTSHTGDLEVSIPASACG